MTDTTRFSISRMLLALLLALSLGFSTTALVGCGGDEPQQSTAAADNEQDNCYGDDLPAVKK